MVGPSVSLDFKVEACYTSMLISEHSFSLILSYVGDYCYKELTSVGIKAQVLKMYRSRTNILAHWVYHIFSMAPYL